MTTRTLPALLVLIALSLPAFAQDFAATNEAEFRKIIPASSKVEKLDTGFRFVEGPVWMPDAGGHLIFSDIPANHLKKWTRSGGTTVFRDPSNNANGNTRDLEGRLVTAEHGSRSITRTEKDGKTMTLVDSFEGKKLNSPNDVVVKSDGTIWFTDPDYGLAGRPKEMPGNYVFRFDPTSKQLTPVVKDFDKPNGLCFSPDEKQLYIADSGRPRHIRVFNVNDDGTLDEGRVFCTIDRGGPDGIRCDTDGRIWSSSGDGVQIFAPDGSLIGRILLPEAGANLCFGGEDGTMLFVTARTSLYGVKTSAKQAAPAK